jgi:hypothetical protein
MAPAKAGKYSICAECPDVDLCKEEFKYCPHDLETLARFVQAYKEGAVNDLRELAGLALRRDVIRRILIQRTPFRMVLHPDDLTRPDSLRQIRQVMARLEGEGWRPLSLHGLVTEASNTVQKV